MPSGDSCSPFADQGAEVPMNKFVNFLQFFDLLSLVTRFARQAKDAPPPFTHHCQPLMDRSDMRDTRLAE